MNFRGILGTSINRRLALLEQLYYHQDGWFWYEDLLDKLGCSLPLLLSDVDLINNKYKKFQIEKDKGFYRLNVDKTTSLSTLYAYILINNSEFQIIEELLYEECENISELAKKLYLSSSSVQRQLKKIEQVLYSVGMNLCYRPLRVEGNEGQIRNFYYHFFSERQSAFESTLPHLSTKHYHIMGQYICDFVKTNQIYEKYVYQKRLLYNMYISFVRIKNGHCFPYSNLRTKGIKLPMSESYNVLKDIAKEDFGLELVPEILRDTLWLTFSDSIVFSSVHRRLALADNRRYRELFFAHYDLVEEYNKMLGFRLKKQDRINLVTVLSNDFYFYEPDGQEIYILWQNRSNLLKEMSKLYGLGVKRIRDLVERFTKKYQMYQKVGFIENYVYLLITMEADSLKWLASQEYLVKVLLLSDLTPTEESFLAKQISNIIYGNFLIDHFEKLSGGGSNLNEELKNYDCLITTRSTEGLPKNYPAVVIDSFLNTQNKQWIQEMISELEEKKGHGNTEIEFFPIVKRF